MNLAQLVDMLRGESPPESPAAIEMSVADGMPPQLLERLAKLQRLGMLNGDALLSLVAQAPVDPLGLAGLLMTRVPAGWTFSSLDCSMVRVLARTRDNTVAAAIRVDLLDNSVESLVLTRSGQLTSFRKYDALAAVERRPPGEWILEEVQRLCDEAVSASARETTP